MFNNLITLKSFAIVRDVNKLSDHCKSERPRNTDQRILEKLSETGKIIPVNNEICYLLYK